MRDEFAYNLMLQTVAGLGVLSRWNNGFSWRSLSPISAKPKLIGRFKGRAAFSANYSGTVPANERIGNLHCTFWTIKQGWRRLRCRVICHRFRPSITFHGDDFGPLFYKSLTVSRAKRHRICDRYSNSEHAGVFHLLDPRCIHVWYFSFEACCR